MGCGGLPPPPEHRFPPGVSGNPGGRPKGSYSVRDALRRELAKDADDDGIGARARKLALALLEAADNGEGERVRAIAATIAEAEGKPTEYVQRRTESTRTLIVRESPKDPPEMP